MIITPLCGADPRAKKVGDCLLHNIWRIPKMTEARVATLAKDPTHRPVDVAVIDLQVPCCTPSRLNVLDDTANCAGAALCAEHAFVDGQRDAVFLTKPAIPQRISLAGSVKPRDFFVFVGSVSCLPEFLRFRGFLVRSRVCFSTFFERDIGFVQGLRSLQSLCVSCAVFLRIAFLPFPSRFRAAFLRIAQFRLQFGCLI